MDTYLRNKLSGEIREVELDSDEFRELQATVQGNGLPMWEQTNYPHASEVKERAAYGELNEEDLGEDHKGALRNAALELDAAGIGPEQNPHLALTPGEIEAGLTPQQKLEDIKSEFADSATAHAAVYDEAADSISDERKQRQAAQQARGLRARAGGSDERSGVPEVEAKDDEQAVTSNRSSGSRSRQKAADPAPAEESE